MASYDLTDMATAKAFARVKASDATAETRLTVLISAMSKAVGRYCGRQWLGKDSGVDLAATSTKIFEYDGRGLLSLAPYEAREIVSVKLNGADLTPRVIGESLTAPNRFLPVPQQKTTEDTYLSIILPQDCREPLTTPANALILSESLVEVEAKWGIAAVDGDVELACLHAIADAYRNPEGGQTRVFEGVEIDEDAEGGSLPRASRALLYPLQRV